MKSDNGIKYEVPVYLSNEAQQIFRYHVPANIRTPSQVAILTTTLEAMDTASKARGLVERDGMVIVSKRSGLPRRNPAITIHEDARKAMLKGFRMLGLHWKEVR